MTTKSAKARTTVARKSAKPSPMQAKSPTKTSINTKAKAARKTAATEAVPTGSKQSKLIALLKSPSGATIEQMKGAQAGSPTRCAAPSAAHCASV